MTEERTAKLKLKRKKCITTIPSAQETKIKPHSLPSVDLRRSSAGSWFDEIDLTTVEHLWKQVLTSVSTDLRNVGWGSVPGLPDSTPHQDAGQRQEKTPVAEVFKVGYQSFEWLPFPAAFPPTAIELPCTTDLGYETSQSNEPLAELVLSKPRDQSHQSTGSHLEVSLMRPASKANDHVFNKNSTQDHKELQSGATQNLKELMVSQKSSTECTKAALVLQKSSTKTVKVPQSLQKVLADNIKESQTSQKRSKKATQRSHGSQKISAKNVQEPQTLPKQTLHLWPTVTLTKNRNVKEEPKWTEPPAQRGSACNDVVMSIGEEPVLASGSGSLLIQDSAGKATEATGSLDNCPICLMQFPKPFSQLDMDSHLAQCLSETTVDVVW